MSRISAVLAAFVVAAAVPASAHHPFAGEYDWKKPVTLTGTITKVEWNNPHVQLTVDGKDEGGASGAWTVEMGGPGALSRHGWTKTTLKQGDQVTIDGWMAKAGAQKMSAKSVKLGSGRELFAASSFYDDTRSVATSGTQSKEKKSTGTSGSAPAKKY